MTIAEIRARFPHPRTFEGDPPDDCDYCCGGAIWMSAGTGVYCGMSIHPTHHYSQGARFPTDQRLAMALKYHNPRLSEATALRFARGIIDHNDRERFEMAWSIATAALEA